MSSDWHAQFKDGLETCAQFLQEYRCLNAGCALGLGLLQASGASAMKVVFRKGFKELSKHQFVTQVGAMLKCAPLTRFAGHAAKSQAVRHWPHGIWQRDINRLTDVRLQ